MNASSESGLCAVRISRGGGDMWVALGVKNFHQYYTYAVSEQTREDEQKRRGRPQPYPFETRRMSLPIIGSAHERDFRSSRLLGHAYPIVRHSSCCLLSGISYDRPDPCPVL